MSNDMVPADIAALINQQAPSADLDAAGKSDAFLPRIQFMSARSGLCEDGTFPVNHFNLISGQSNEDAGETVDALVMGVRSKAMDTSGDELIITYEPKPDDSGAATGIFRDIQVKSDTTKNSGCMYGLEFLIWVPSKKTFATFFMGTNSLRRDSPTLRARIGKPVTLISYKAKTKKFQWMTAKGVDCTTPFEPPTKEAVIKAFEEFNNPKTTELAPVAEGEATRER